MSLRDDLIEAGARAFNESAAEVMGGDPDWEKLHVEFQEFLLAGASHAVDAVLDVLADRADEWMMKALITAYGNVRGGERLDADDLIAVLRGDTE